MSALRRTALPLLVFTWVWWMITTASVALPPAAAAPTAHTSPTSASTPPAPTSALATTSASATTGTTSGTSTTATTSAPPPVPSEVDHPCPEDDEELPVSTWPGDTPWPETWTPRSDMAAEESSNLGSQKSKVLATASTSDTIPISPTFPTTSAPLPVPSEVDHPCPEDDEELPVSTWPEDTPWPETWTPRSDMAAEESSNLGAQKSKILATASTSDTIPISPTFPTTSAPLPVPSEVDHPCPEDDEELPVSTWPETWTPRSDIAEEESSNLGGNNNLSDSLLPLAIAAVIIASVAMIFVRRTSGAEVGEEPTQDEAVLIFPLPPSVNAKNAKTVINCNWVRLVTFLEHHPDVSYLNVVILLLSIISWWFFLRHQHP